MPRFGVYLAVFFAIHFQSAVAQTTVSLTDAPGQAKAQYSRMSTHAAFVEIVPSQDWESIAQGVMDSPGFEASAWHVQELDEWVKASPPDAFCQKKRYLVIGENGAIGRYASARALTKVRQLFYGTLGLPGSIGASVYEGYRCRVGSVLFSDISNQARVLFRAMKPEARPIEFLPESEWEKEAESLLNGGFSKRKVRATFLKQETQIADSAVCSKFTVLLAGKNDQVFEYARDRTLEKATQIIDGFGRFGFSTGASVFNGYGCVVRDR